jgi:hypothetical protein
MGIAPAKYSRTKLFASSRLSGFFASEDFSQIMKGSCYFSVPILLLLASWCACKRPPQDAPSLARDSQKLPFDRRPRTSGISPSQSLVPSITKLPEGTNIAVSLQNALSSATSHAGDSFAAAIDEPVVIDNRIVIAKGAPATGRVLEAKSARSSFEPGYMRIVLVSVTVGARPIMIETSSIFAKGGVREEPNARTQDASPTAHEDIVFDSGRRFNFRLAQTVDLQNSDLKNADLQNANQDNAERQNSAPH